MNKQNAREYLSEIPLWTRKKNTLDQVRDFLEALGNPDQALKIIHVAGTNGKGSVCADLTAVLLEAGYHVGTFVSPHLADVTERFLLDGKPVGEPLFEESFQAVRGIVEVMREKGYCHPTFFEFVFLMAMVMFKTQKPDYVILETGLGGRLDTTNVIRKPLACVITSISLDHTQYLGNTIEQIAGEKSGIIKPGIPVIYDGTSEAAGAVIRAQAQRLQAAAYPVTAADERLAPLFAAPYQAVNASLAAKTLQVLNLPGIDEKVVFEGLSHVSWPGRMEEVRPGIWLDGAHNPGGIAAFIQAVKQQPDRGGEMHLLFAAVSDKDYREMIQMLMDGLPIARTTVVQLESSRGLKADTLAQLFREAGCPAVEAYGQVSQALEQALACKKEADRLFVAGSLYLIGEIKAALAVCKA